MENTTSFERADIPQQCHFAFGCLSCNCQRPCQRFSFSKTLSKTREYIKVKGSLSTEVPPFDKEVDWSSEDKSLLVLLWVLRTSFGAKDLDLSNLSGLVLQMKPHSWYKRNHNCVYCEPRMCSLVSALSQIWCGRIPSPTGHSLDAVWDVRSFVVLLRNKSHLHSICLASQFQLISSHV